MTFTYRTKDIKIYIDVLPLSVLIRAQHKRDYVISAVSYDKEDLWIDTEFLLKRCKKRATRRWIRSVINDIHIFDEKDHSN